MAFRAFGTEGENNINKRHAGGFLNTSFPSTQTLLTTVLVARSMILSDENDYDSDSGAPDLVPLRLAGSG